MMNFQMISLSKKRKIRPILLLQPQVQKTEEKDEYQSKNTLNINSIKKQYSTMFSGKERLQSLTNFHPLEKKPLKPNQPYESLLTKYFEALSHDSITSNFIHIKNLQKTNSITSTNITPHSNKIELSQPENNSKEGKTNVFLSGINTPQLHQKNIAKSSSCHHIIKKPNAIPKRLRSYQPSIDFDWKTKCGLTQKKHKLIPFLVNSIEFQIHSFQEQIGLLFDNINYYKSQIVRDEHFNGSFQNMTYQSKVNLNKNFEELCGILLLCPRALLMEFYQYIEELDDIYIPNKDKFVEVYVSNETKCFHYNFDLLMELCIFFTKCFNFYLTLSKEVEGIAFKRTHYNYMISILERARYDISAIIKRGENAIKVYKADLALIERIRKEDKDKAKLTMVNNEEMKRKTIETELTRLKVKTERNIVEKIVNGYIFKKKEERLRISRITNVIQLSRECFSDGELDENKEKPFKIKQIKSIMSSKVMTKLRKYFDSDIQQRIISSKDGKVFKNPKAKKRIISINI